MVLESQPPGALEQGRDERQIWGQGLWADCDSDTLLVKVDSPGPACHTGNRTCFFKKLA
ncbi:MAG: phosphoribosyl-AMP cyclohydrolase [Collinsella sp.]